jgi:plastocyanin
MIRDPEFFEPETDPVTGQIKAFKGWVDAAYKPEAGATPYPACWTAEFASGPAAPSSSAAPSGSAAPTAAGGQIVSIVAQGIAFTTTTVTAPAGVPFVIAFDNQDAGTPHNVAIKDASGAEVFKGEIFSGVATKNYEVPALKAGTYTFTCTVHPNMTGTLTAN